MWGLKFFKYLCFPFNRQRTIEFTIGYGFKIAQPEIECFQVLPVLMNGGANGIALVGLRKIGLPDLLQQLLLSRFEVCKPAVIEPPVCIGISGYKEKQVAATMSDNMTRRIFIATANG